MKKLLLMTAAVFSISNALIGTENNTPEQDSTEQKQIFPNQDCNNEDAVKTSRLVDGGPGTYPDAKPSLTGHAELPAESKKSIRKAIKLFHEIPSITTDFIAEYPLETLGAVAIFGWLMPKLTVIAVGSGLIIKYKNTEASQKISDMTDQVIVFIKKEYKDITENYNSKKQQ